MFKIGCHLSFSNGYAAMARDALYVGANVFQFFTRNPRGGKAKPIDQNDINEFNKIATENHIGFVLAHAPYTMNPSAAFEDIRNYTAEIMSDDLKRMSYIPKSMYNFHPGCHVKQGVEIGIKEIIELLEKIIKVDTDTIITLEAMAGKGTEIGGRFEELKTIIDGVSNSERLAVCLDTCHVFDGGYDIRNDLDGVLTNFDNIVGLSRLKAIHLNDSKFGLSSHKDRHACIGEGELGLEAIKRIINHPALKELPFYLETPNDLEGYKKEIDLLKQMYN